MKSIYYHGFLDCFNEIGRISKTIELFTNDQRIEILSEGIKNYSIVKGDQIPTSMTAEMCELLGTLVHEGIDNKYVELHIDRYVDSNKVVYQFMNQSQKKVRIEHPIPDILINSLIKFMNS